MKAYIYFEMMDFIILLLFVWFFLKNIILGEKKIMQSSVILI